MRRPLLALVLAGALSLCTSTADAATFTVDKLADDAGGACTVAPDDCSLRSAITVANGVAGADTIQVPAGTVTLTSSLPSVVGDATIAGAGARQTTVDGAGAYRPFRFDGTTPSVWTLQDLAVRGAADSGALAPAAVESDSGTFTVRRVAVVDNAVGGIFAQSITLVEDSLVARNSGPVFGGVLGAELLTMRNTTVTQNSAFADVVGSIPVVYGAGVVTGCAGSVAHSTITDNTTAPGSPTLGGNNIGNLGYGFSLGCLFSAGRIRNSVVAGGGEGGNCNGGLISLGGNVDSDGSCAFGRSTDRPEVDPLLAPLADNGGPTDTRALLSGSPALGIGKDCAAADQRGVARPQGGACDAGALESALAPPAPPAPPTPRP